MTWQSALGHKATGAASLTVGGHMTGYVTWQSALGHKATGAASLTVGEGGGERGGADGC